MYDRGKGGATGGRSLHRKKPVTGISSLKPNEAYEPGFGKYTLAESQLKAREQFRSSAVKDTYAHAAKTAHTPPDSSKASAKHNEPGDSHYPEAKGNNEEDRKMREDNTNMHNNW